MLRPNDPDKLIDALTLARLQLELLQRRIDRGRLESGDVRQHVAVALKALDRALDNLTDTSTHHVRHPSGTSTPQA